MARVLVLFYSRTGSTARLADAVVEGARSVRFAEVDVRRLETLTPAAEIEREPRWRESLERLRGQYRTLEDVDAVAEYDALVVGGPTRHGVVAAELQQLLDRLGRVGARGALADRVGAAFTTVPAGQGGHELALLSVLAPMCALGMLPVPPGPADAAAPHGASPVGASPFGATTTSGADEPSADDLAAARRLGARVARVAEWVRHAKGHEHGGGEQQHGHHHHHHHHH